LSFLNTSCRVDSLFIASGNGKSDQKDPVVSVLTGGNWPPPTAEWTADTAAKEALVQVTAELAQWKERCFALERDLKSNSLNPSADMLREQLAASMKEEAKLRNENVQLKETMKKLESQRALGTDPTIKELNQKISTLESMTVEESREAEVDFLVKNLGILTEKLSKTLIFEAQVAVKTKRIEELEKQAADRQTLIDLSASQVSDLAEVIETLKSDFDEVQKQNEALKTLVQLDKKAAQIENDRLLALNLELEEMHQKKVDSANALIKKQAKLLETHSKKQ